MKKKGLGLCCLLLAFSCSMALLNTVKAEEEAQIEVLEATGYYVVLNGEITVDISFLAYEGETVLVIEPYELMEEGVMLETNSTINEDIEDLLKKAAQVADIEAAHWYASVQTLIYETLGYAVSFSDESQYEADKAAILSQSLTLPSFTEERLTFSLGDTLVIEDQNNVLDEVEINVDGSLEWTKEGNQIFLTCNTNAYEEGSIQCTRPLVSSASIVYRDQDGYALWTMEENRTSVAYRIQSYGVIQIEKTKESLSGKDEDGWFYYETAALPINAMIYARENVCDAWGDLLYEAGELVETLSNKSTSSLLAAGTYVVVLDEDEYDVTIMKSQEAISIQTIVSKESMHGEVELSVANDSNEAGTLSLYAKDNIVNQEGNLVVEEGTCLITYDMVEATFATTFDLPYGTYIVVVEDECYEITIDQQKQSFSFTLEAKKQDEEVSSQTDTKEEGSLFDHVTNSEMMQDVENFELETMSLYELENEFETWTQAMAESDLETYALTLSLVDEDDQALDASFILYDENMEVLALIDTEDGEAIIDELDSGTYYLQQVEAASGYRLSTSFSMVKIDTDDEALTIVNYDEIVISDDEETSLASEDESIQNHLQVRLLVSFSALLALIFKRIAA